MNKRLANHDDGIEIVCPHDRSPMTWDSHEVLHCNVCSRSFAETEGVIQLLESKDEFYEGAYQNQTLFMPKSERGYHVWPLWMISNGYPWYVRKHVAPKATVVELGCAGGVHYFGSRYTMIGVDVSFRSLANSCSSYKLKIQANAALCIPLADNSVDAVISSYFWEHIPPPVKSIILTECRRILKPGGKLVFLYDVETNNPLLRQTKARKPDDYKRLFIDGDGHFGYQKPKENTSLFVQHGFSILEHHGMEKTPFQSPSVFEKLKTLNGVGRPIFSVGAKLGTSPWLYPYTLLVRSIDQFVCPWLPYDWARIDLVVAEKQK